MCLDVVERHSLEHSASIIVFHKWLCVFPASVESTLLTETAMLSDFCLFSCAVYKFSTYLLTHCTCYGKAQKRSINKFTQINSTVWQTTSSNNDTVVLTSDTRHKTERRPFPQESVGGWRKDEFQWMSLALAGDRKFIWSQNLSTNYSSWNVLSLHSSSFTAVPSPFCTERESQWGNLAMPGSPGRIPRFTWKGFPGSPGKDSQVHLERIPRFTWKDSQVHLERIPRFTWKGCPSKQRVCVCMHWVLPGAASSIVGGTWEVSRSAHSSRRCTRCLEPSASCGPHESSYHLDASSSSNRPCGNELSYDCTATSGLTPAWQWYIIIIIITSSCCSNITSEHCNIIHNINKIVFSSYWINLFYF